MQGKVLTSRNVVLSEPIRGTRFKEEEGFVLMQERILHEPGPEVRPRPAVEDALGP